MSTTAAQRGRSVRQGPDPGPDLDPIVGRIAAADARRRLRFRLVFVATWVVFIGGLVALLVSSGAVDLPWLEPWWWFILGGAPITIFISVASIMLAIVFALLGAMGRISTTAPVYALATLYVSLVRGTPLIVQIIFVWLALPQIWPGAADIDLIWLGIFALGFNYGAYMTEIFRAGIQAVPGGQREAASALGMTQRRIMIRIVLPQAVRIVTPAVGNEFIAMIKDSALVYIIGVQELLWRASTIGKSKFHSFETLLLAAVVYWVLTMIFSYFQERLERRMARSDR
jgi:polar amino acid transport system permease protein